MRVNRGLLGWGVFFITLGTIPLAVRYGFLDAAIARRSIELWPLILVGIGLGLALQRTRAAAVGGVVVALTFGLIGGGLVAGGFGPSGSFALCGFGGGTDGGTAKGPPPAMGTFGPQAIVDLSADCGSLAVDTAPGSAWTVISTRADGRWPAITASDARLQVRVPVRRGFDVPATTASWDVTLPRDPALRLDLAVNAGSLAARLGGLQHLSALDVSVNAGDAHVDLAGALDTASVSASVNFGSLAISLPTPGGTLTGTLSTNAGSLEICVPAGVALRFRAGDHALGSDNFGDRGLTEAGGTWTTGGFDAATSRIDLAVSANLGSITLNPEDGCG